MNDEYPHFNDKSEGTWKFNKERDEEIEKAGKQPKISISDMDPYILKELCFTINENTLPSLIECCHHQKEDK